MATKSARPLKISCTEIRNKFDRDISQAQMLLAQEIKGHDSNQHKKDLLALQRKIEKEKKEYVTVSDQLSADFDAIAQPTHTPSSTGLGGRRKYR